MMLLVKSLVNHQDFIWPITLRCKLHYKSRKITVFNSISFHRSAFFSIILLLMILSTGYDIHCTIYHREFSTNSQQYLQNSIAENVFVKFRQKTSTSSNVFCIHKREKDIELQKIEFIGKYGLFEWAACHINSMDCHRSHVFCLLLSTDA